MRSVQDFLDALGRYPTVLTAVGGVGAALCGAGLRQSWGSWAIIPWAFGVAAFVVLPTISTRQNRLQQGRRAARNSIKKVLEACASAYGFPERHVRANLMLLSKNRRRVDPDTAFNMGGDADCDLEIDATAGVSGEAFVQRATTYGNLALALQPGGPTWGLRDSERAKVRQQLKSILSVPVFNPDDPEGTLLGTLQIDSDLTFEEMEFDRPDRRAVAERFGDVVALLIRTGR
jgi:hypothetical protein